MTSPGPDRAGTGILARMAIGLKLTVEFSGSERQRATLGDLKSFVARAEAGGCADGDELQIETNENDEVTGFALYLDPNA